VSTVVAKAPARISLAGGGTDLPAFYERHGGAVVSLTIDAYATAHAARRAADLELVSADTGARELIPTPQFSRRMRPPILAEEFLLYQKAVAWHFGIERGTLSLSSAIPAGAGLGSSGAVCVALVRAAAEFVGEELDRSAVAETAFRIEAHVLRRGCGKQDQYASAFGGLNLIEFFRDGSVDVTPLDVDAQARATLQRRLMVFSNGSRRSAVLPLQEQARRSESDPDTVLALARLKDMAYETREALERGNADAVGQIMDEAWKAKQHLNSTVASPEILRSYSVARAAGAVGGKLAGAGLGGTLVLYCHEDGHDDVRRALAAEGWRQRAVAMEQDGAVLCADDGAGNDIIGG